MKSILKVKRIKVLFCLSALALLVAIIPTYKETLRYVEKLSSSDFLVIDPGHGGFDGGAQSSEGIPEKDINLQIAKEIKALAISDGWNVVMTRETDISLSEDQGTIRHRKTQDLLNRKQIITDVAPQLAISIHLNSFKEDVSVRGAQVFYPKECKDELLSKQCQALAEAIQTNLTKGLDDGTNRSVLKKEGVLILKNTSCPIVLVECGFLSNPAEAELLTDVEYQRKLAKYIYQGILDFTGKTPTPKLEIIKSN